MLAPPRNAPGPRPARASRLRPLRCLVLAAAVLLLPFPAAASWAPGELSDLAGPSWSNGVTLCQFASLSPTVAVSAVGLSGSGLSVNLTGIEEVSSSGVPVAVARMSSANWSVANASTPDTFDLAYTAHAAIVLVSGSAAPVGSVDVRVDFLLPAYAEDDDNASGLGSVVMQIAVANWTWQAPSDSLAMMLSLWPSFPADERLESTSSGGSAVASTSIASGAVREYFRAGPTANISGTTGGTATVSVEPKLNVTPALAAVELSVAGSGYRSLVYAATIELAPPGSIAGIPIYEFVLVGTSALTVTVAVALGARWLRRRPSDLVYVEEET